MDVNILNINLSNIIMIFIGILSNTQARFEAQFMKMSSNGGWVEKKCCLYREVCI